MRSVIALAAVLALCACAASARPPLQSIQAFEKAVPLRIAQVLPTGEVGPWIEYTPSAGGPDLQEVMVWDAFEPDETGWPTGGDTCGTTTLPETGSGRWYFIPPYQNGYVSNDMQFNPAFSGSGVTRLELAWYQGANENLVIIVELFDNFDQTCTIGDPTGQGNFMGGIALDFGFQTTGAGYYITDVPGIDPTWLPLPPNGSGSYNMWSLQSMPPGIVLSTNNQFMLWGTGDHETPTPDDRPGTETDVHWDDDNPPDGFHTAIDECYSNWFGLCPDPLGAMICFYAEGGPGPADGDLNCDGVVNAFDIDPFVKCLTSGTPTPPCQDCLNADINDDGVINAFDIDPFVVCLTTGNC